MRKPAFCICENKDADQLRGNREADQAFVFATWIVQSLDFLNTKSKASSRLLWLYSRLLSDLVRNPEDRFSHNAVHMSLVNLLYAVTYCSRSVESMCSILKQFHTIGHSCYI